MIDKCFPPDFRDNQKFGTSFQTVEGNGFKERTVTNFHNQGSSMSKTSRKQIDQDEKKIMAELQKNSYENLDVTAKRLKFSRQKIWRLIKRLEADRIIWGYTAIVDDEKMSLKNFTLMLKRSAKPMDEKTLDTFMSPRLQELSSNAGASLESTYFVQGEYDWVLTFTAPDIMQAKRFCEKMRWYPIPGFSNG
jgi:DNA-binding Lrp family transcriptional regulator